MVPIQRRSSHPLGRPANRQNAKKPGDRPGFRLLAPIEGLLDQWNYSSSVEPVRAFTLDEPPWITVVTSSK